MRDADRIKKGFAKEERFLIFSLSGITYGIPLLKAKEVCALGELTTIPYCPFYVDGVMNLRGRMIVAINLSKRLRVQEKIQEKVKEGESRAEKKRCLIVLKGNEQGLGLIVDSVDQVLSFAEGEVQNTVHDHESKQFLIGAVEKENGFTFMLNVDELVEKTNLYLKQEETKDVA